MGKIISYISLYNNVGKSYILNNWVDNYTKSGNFVCIIDCDFDNGNIKKIINAPHCKNIYNLSQLAKNSKDNNLHISNFNKNKYATRKYFIDKPKYKKDLLMDKQEVLNIISVLKNTFDIIIVNMTLSFKSDLENEFFKQSNEIILSCDQYEKTMFNWEYFFKTFKNVNKNNIIITAENISPKDIEFINKLKSYGIKYQNISYINKKTDQ